MKNWPLLLASLAALPVLTGCATTTVPAAEAQAAVPPVAQTQDARLAAMTALELDRRARHDPDSLTAVAPQLRALAMALAEPVREPGASSLAPLAGPPADMLTAPSLWHGIHLASYRSQATIIAGWEELRGRFAAVLGDKEARVEAVTLAGRGDFLRLQAGPYDSLAAARDACAVIVQAGEYCMPVDFSGRPLADITPEMSH